MRKAAAIPNVVMWAAAAVAALMSLIMVIYFYQSQLLTYIKGTAYIDSTKRNKSDTPGVSKECVELSCSSDIYARDSKYPGSQSQHQRCNCSACKSEHSALMSEFLAGATKRVKPPFFFKDLATFVNYAENPRVICPQLRYMGGRRRPTGERDGDKAVCFNPVYNISPNDCIVYSFGISTDWSFDDAMAGLGCQVYSFDHTIGLPSHDRSDRVHFYNIGLAHRDVTQTGQNANYTLMSLTHIMDMLGHLNKTIDYVKIDIEASEIYILQQLAEESVRLLQIKQLGIEMHPMENLHEFVYDLFVLLEYLGFTTFDARRTAVEELWYTVEQYPNLVLSKCYEMAWAQVETIYW